MGIDEYQGLAMGTCLPSAENFAYMALNLAAEVGELAGKVAKAVRRGELSLEENELSVECGWDRWLELERELRLEAGDVAWQLAGLCSAMGWSLEEVCAENLAKLSGRASRGTLDGSGDSR